jgi:hypothetical protein
MWMTILFVLLVFLAVIGLGAVVLMIFAIHDAELDTVLHNFSDYVD